MQIQSFPLCSVLLASCHQKHLAAILGCNLGRLPSFRPRSLALGSRRIRAQRPLMIRLLPVPGSRLDAFPVCLVREAPVVHGLFAIGRFYSHGFKPLRVMSDLSTQLQQDQNKEKVKLWRSVGLRTAFIERLCRILFCHPFER
jgi:hypothetical protein